MGVYYSIEVNTGSSNDVTSLSGYSACGHIIKWSINSYGMF